MKQQSYTICNAYNIHRVCFGGKAPLDIANWGVMGCFCFIYISYCIVFLTLQQSDYNLQLNDWPSYQHLNIELCAPVHNSPPTQPPPSTRIIHWALAGIFSSIFP